MSSVYAKIKCPKCGNEYDIEKRQQQVFCSFGCAVYFNRLGEIEEYDQIKSSSRPLYDSL